MGIYDRLILPRLIELAMRNSHLAGYRQATIKAARARVLEIGVGSGLNLPLYGARVDGVYGIDPSPELLGRANERIADAHVAVSLVRASAEQLPFVWPEPFGRTALEAFIAGIPVIASRRGGLPEFAEGSALLIDNPAEPQDWRDAVVRVRIDEELRRQMVANGRECAARFPPLPEALRLIRRLETIVSS